MENSLAVQQNKINMFDPVQFEALQRLCKMYVSSELVPETYRPVPNKRTEQQASQAEPATWQSDRIGTRQVLRLRRLRASLRPEEQPCGCFGVSSPPRQISCRTSQGFMWNPGLPEPWPILRRAPRTLSQGGKNCTRRAAMEVQVLSDDVFCWHKHSTPKAQSRQ